MADVSFDGLLLDDGFLADDDFILHHWPPLSVVFMDSKSARNIPNYERAAGVVRVRGPTVKDFPRSPGSVLRAPESFDAIIGKLNWPILLHVCYSLLKRRFRMADQLLLLCEGLRIQPGRRARAVDEVRGECRAPSRISSVILGTLAGETMHQVHRATRTSSRPARNLPRGVETAAARQIDTQREEAKREVDALVRRHRDMP
jgi:hypothetical protein